MWTRVGMDRGELPPSPRVPAAFKNDSPGHVLQRREETVSEGGRAGQGTDGDRQSQPWTCGVAFPRPAPPLSSHMAIGRPLTSWVLGVLIWKIGHKSCFMGSRECQKPVPSVWH